MFRVLLLAVCGLLSIGALSQDTSVSYQGQLIHDGAPYTGIVNLTFRLYDQPTGGAEVAAQIQEADWPVVEGLFQISLDFGAAFDGTDRFLEVEVDGTILAPRQSVRPAPVALYALAGSDWQLNGSNVYYSAGQVGIGTDSPAAPLEIVSNSVIAQPQLLLTESHDDFARLSLGNVVNDRFWTMAGLTRGETPAQDRLNFYNSALGDLLTISGAGTGTVGIRTSFPSSNYALDVNGGAIVRRNNDGTNQPHLYLLEPAGEVPIRMFWRHNTAGRHWIMSSVAREPGVDSDRFALDHSASGTLMSVYGNGRTGIGLDPLSRLSVRSDGQWNPSIGNGRGDFYIGDGDVGLSVGVALGGGGRGVTRIWTSGGVEHLFLGSADYGTSLVVMPGQVGVNTTSPQATLDVDGDLRVRDLADAGVTGHRQLHVLPNGQVTAGEEILVQSIHSAAFGSSLGNALPKQFAAIAFFDAGVDDVLSAPLLLPNGAEVTGVTAWFRDQNATVDLSFRVAILELGTNSMTFLAWGQSTGNVAEWLGVDLTLAGSTANRFIDNETRAYVIQSSPVASGNDAFGARVNWQGSSAGLQAIVVRYRQH